MLATVTLTASAAPTEILYPSGFLSEYNERPDGSALCSFRFQTQNGGFYQLYNGDIYTAAAYGDFTFSPNYQDYDFYQISWYPLGTPVGRPEATGAVIDLTDFQSGIYFDFKTGIQLQLNFSNGGSDTAYYSTRSAGTFYWYDENYQFITSTSTSEVVRSWRYSTPNVSDNWVIQNTFRLNMPDNARYLVPRIIVKVIDEGPGAVTTIKSTNSEFFDIVCTKDAVLGNSLTMKAIENKLGELNEKADTIINGTDEQQGHYDQVVGEIQDADEELSDALDDLEQYQEFDTGTVFGVINEFLDADGWLDIKYLLEPFLKWQHTATMMLFILAFSTLRTLLLGR